MSSSLTFARYTLHYRASAAFMPRHKCNVLRSAFGAAIGRVLCGGQHHEHRGQLCDFARLFDGCGESRPAQFANVPPYTFGCADERTRYRSGDALQVLFTLAAPDCFEPSKLEAVWRAMGEGLANPANRFALERVTTRVVTEEDLLTRAQSLAGADRLTIELATPLRLRTHKKSRAIAHPTPADITRFAWQRVWALGEAWFDGLPVWLPQTVGEAATLAEAVETLGQRFEWVDWGRQSQRQHRHVDMGGVCGRLTVGGDLRPLLPLLVLAEVAGVGAGVTTGNGRIRLIHS